MKPGGRCCHTLRAVATLGAIVLAVVAGPAGADEAARVERVSNKSFDETVKQLEWGFGGYGMTIVNRFDYQNVLPKIKVQVRKNRVFEVMRRAWVKIIFASDPAAALDVPLRVYVYERDDGKTVVAYYRPSVTLAAYDNAGLNGLGRELDTALRDLVQVATR